MWKVHDMDRPKPAVVTPHEQTASVPPPERAVVLFGGTDLDGWTTPTGEAPGWKVENGYMEIVPGSGPIRSKERFGDVQLHVEWATPEPPIGTGQDRGNSGIFLMGQYEVQVLDSYRADTYADGQAGAIYSQYPPLLNVSRPPGEWQTYDIFFRRPRFGSDGALLEPARLTVVHNGVLVQNNEELVGRTAWLKPLPYDPHEDALPVEIQDHGSPVRFRNIWALPLPERPAPDAAYAAADRPMLLSPRDLDRYTGTYERPNATAPIIVTRDDDHLLADFYWRPGALELVPVAQNEFVLKDTDGRVVFDVGADGRPTGLTFHLGGAVMPATKAP